MNLPDRLRDVADLVESDALPPAAVEALERSLRRVEGYYWLSIAAGHFESLADLVATLHRETWRLEVWSRRGGPPPTASPAQTAAFNALECLRRIPCSRHLRRLLRGHSMSKNLDHTDA